MNTKLQEKLERTVDCALKQIKETFMILSGMPATMFILHSDGNSEAINLNDLATKFNTEPGVVINIIKPKIKENPDIYATIFVTEAWYTTHDIGDQNPEEVLKSADANYVLPSKDPARKEMLFVSIESRDGYKQIHQYPIQRIDEMPYLMDGMANDGTDMTGRCVGIFD